MASQSWVVSLVVFTSAAIHTILALPPSQPYEIPFTCYKESKPCNSILYQHNDLTEMNISLLYSVNVSQIQAIGPAGNQDHLVTVPCSCQNVNNTLAYFYDVTYSVKHNDTFLDVSDEFYSGQAWEVGDEGTNFTADTNATMHLLCGCTESGSQVMVTYTVEQHDTLSDIANRLSAEVGDIESANKGLISTPGFIDPGWVLFVPMYKNGIPQPAGSKKRKEHKWAIIFGVLLSVIALLLCVPIIMCIKRKKRSQEHDKEKAKAVSKTTSFLKSASGHIRYLSRENMEGQIIKAMYSQT